MPKTQAADSLHAMKYRGPNEDFREAMNRVAFGLADNGNHYHAFREILLDQRFLPGGRVQGAIGAQRKTAAHNCFVAPTIDDAYVGDIQGNLTADSIMGVAHAAAATMRMGGGIGYDFSTLRPRGAPILQLESHSSGPVSFMRIFDAICLCTASSGHRRGAQMGVLRIDHPDVEEFIRSKQREGILTGFNISLAVTDAFMSALAKKTTFDLKFNGQTHKTVDAQELWEKVMRSTWDHADPGVLFIDRINEMNNLYYCETIAATNPCVTGETLIAVAGRGPIPIKQLAEEGKDVPVFAVDSQGETVVRWGRQPRLTGQQQPIIKVMLDDGSTFRCTLNHKIPLRDGREVEAQDLINGDSLYRTDLDQTCSTELGTLEDDLKFVSFKPDGHDDVYNLTVDEFHNYTVITIAGTFALSGVKLRNCGEQPLPPNGACLLGSYNLTKYLKRGFDTMVPAGISNDGLVVGTLGPSYTFDFDQLRADTPAIVRAMDNIIDRTLYPLHIQKVEALAKRRMGLGVTGLANAAEACGYPYGSEPFLVFETLVLETIKEETYRASAALAAEKSPFPLFDAELYLAGKFTAMLSDETRSLIKKHGIRNSHLTSIAPTGTISMCADNVSGGLEPVFAYQTSRPINTPDGQMMTTIGDYGAAFLGVKGKLAADVTAKEHVAVLVTAQRQVDSAISKTCNVDGRMEWEDFKQIYVDVFEGGGKGCTTFNSDGLKGALLTAAPDTPPGAVCEIINGQRSCE